MNPPVLVIKFGGTSLATAARLRHARRVRAHLCLDIQVGVIASAGGHTTDRILSQIARLGIPPGEARREIDGPLYR